jgi:NAD/NADP transhydrogenase beta subunit
MQTLERWAGWLAVAGGALLAVMMVAVVLTNPATSPAWNLFWVVVALLGAGVLGLSEGARSAVGQLGRVSAWVSAVGGLGLLLVGVYAAVTNQLDSGQGGADPLWPFWMVTFGAWLVGNIGFAGTLIRGRSLSSVGAWFVVIGAVTGVAALLFGGENPPAALYLVFVLFGVGWMVLGYAATRQAG